MAFVAAASAFARGSQWGSREKQLTGRVNYKCSGLRGKQITFFFIDNKLHSKANIVHWHSRTRTRMAKGLSHEFNDVTCHWFIFICFTGLSLGPEKLLSLEYLSLCMTKIASQGYSDTFHLCVECWIVKKINWSSVQSFNWSNRQHLSVSSTWTCLCLSGDICIHSFVTH